MLSLPDSRPDTRQLALVDHLLTALPAEADRLLDLRLLLAGRGHPGTCARLYCELRAALPVWRQPLLDALGELLEEELSLQIVIENSTQRARRCLGLARARSLASWCEETMRAVAAENPDDSRLHLSFGWTEPVRPAR